MSSPDDPAILAAEFDTFMARAGVTVCSVRATVKKAGKVKLACVLNAAGKRLRKKGALKVLLTTTFAPKKGTKATSTRTVTISKR